MALKIDYRVLAAASAASLEEQVNDLANNDGYTPQGGVAITAVKSKVRESYLRGNGMITENQILFTQAMVKVTEYAE